METEAPRNLAIHRYLGIDLDPLIRFMVILSKVTFVIYYGAVCLGLGMSSPPEDR